MKKHLGFLYTLLLVATLMFTSFAQVTRTKVADGKEIISASNISYLTTTGSAYSEKFSLTEQDAFSWNTYLWRFAFTGTKPTTGTIKVINYLQGSMDGTNWTNLDTLKNTDSSLTTTPYITTSNINNWKYPWYRWEFKGGTGNIDSVTVTAKMWNPMLDKFLKP